MSFFLGETSRPLGSKVTPWVPFGSGINAYLARSTIWRLKSVWPSGAPGALTEVPLRRGGAETLGHDHGSPLVTHTLPDPEAASLAEHGNLFLKVQLECQLEGNMLEQRGAAC